MTPRLNAYVLAADPTWIESSLRSYYAVVDRIVVCFDRDRLGWTGLPIDADECIDRVRALDRDGKVELLEGSYYRPSSTPMENDTNQRRHALAAAAPGADWVLELDTDEVLPDARYLVEKLADVPLECDACMWPMRVLYKQVGPTEFLEVATKMRTPYSEYPGPIACRPRAEMVDARRVSGRSFTFGIRYGLWDWISRPAVRPDAWLDRGNAVLHFSWARTEPSIRRKLSSWSHARDFDGERYLSEVWGPAEQAWRSYRDFHPIYAGLWPALRRSQIAPELCAHSA